MFVCSLTVYIMSIIDEAHCVKALKVLILHPKNGIKSYKLFGAN